MDDDGWDDTDDPSDDNEQLAALSIVSRLCDNQCIPLLERQISNLCRLLLDHDLLPPPECCNVPHSLDCWQRLILFILILHKTGYLRSIFILRLMLSPPSDYTQAQS